MSERWVHIIRRLDGLTHFSRAAVVPADAQPSALRKVGPHDPIDDRDLVVNGCECGRNRCACIGQHRVDIAIDGCECRGNCCACVNQNVVNNAVDPEADPLTYTFRVYADPLLTTVVAEVAGVAEGGGGTTSWTVSPPLGNTTYYWRAHAADQEFRGPYMETASFEVTGSTAVADAGAAPGRPVLGAPMPNPFSVGAQVSYSLPERGRVRVDIYDVHGRHVLRLVEGLAEAGRHMRRWDGRTTAGEQAPAGVYLVQLHVNGMRLTQKLIRLP